MVTFAGDAQCRDMTTPTKLKELRKAAGKSQEQLAHDAGLSHSQISRYENGKSSVFAPGAEAIAAALKLPSAAELLSDRMLRVPLLGYVGAGDKIYPVDDEPVEMVEAPPGEDGVIAVRVRGTSMNPAYRDGDIVMARGEQLPPDGLIGKDCIVQIDGGPRLLKRLHRGSEPGLFRLFSYESHEISEDVRLTWAAPVRWVRR